MSFKEIPLLDLSLASDPATKPAFLGDLRHALLEVGFLYLKNMGIPDELFSKVIREGKAFFDIPREEKWVASNSSSLIYTPKDVRPPHRNIRSTGR
jgi:isopenicillin N synthase-like dioxygenase